LDGWGLKVHFVAGKLPSLLQSLKSSPGGVTRQAGGVGGMGNKRCRPEGILVGKIRRRYSDVVLQSQPVNSGEYVRD